MFLYTIACMPGQDRQFACLLQSGMLRIDHTRLTLRCYVSYITQKLPLSDELLIAAILVACTKIQPTLAPSYNEAYVTVDSIIRLCASYVFGYVAWIGP